MKKLSPLAPGGFLDMPPVPGVSLAAACCGLRYAGRLDVRINEYGHYRSLDYWIDTREST